MGLPRAVSLCGRATNASVRTISVAGVPFPVFSEMRGAILDGCSLVCITRRKGINGKSLKGSSGMQE